MAFSTFCWAVETFFSCLWRQNQTFKAKIWSFPIPKQSTCCCNVKLKLKKVKFQHIQVFAESHYVYSDEWVNSCSRRFQRLHVMLPLFISGLQSTRKPHKYKTWKSRRDKWAAMMCQSYLRPINSEISSDLLEHLHKVTGTNLNQTCAAFEWKLLQ